MTRKYDYDWIDGREVPQLVITENYIITGTHQGTVHVEAGLFTLEGTLNGTLDVQPGVAANIKGTQQGSVTIGEGATVTVTGAIQGSTTIHHNAILIVEAGGRLTGTLSNYGKVVVRGVFGGVRTGGGELIIEGDGYIKQPTIRDGVAFYEW